jgi:hypothetical protein
MRIPGIPEEVELVTDFEQLWSKSFSIIWVSPCRRCPGKQHRHYLMQKAVGPVLDGQSLGIANTRFLINEPPPPCVPPWAGRAVVTPVDVAAGVIWRVVDPTVNEGTTGREKIQGLNDVAFPPLKKAPA